MPTLFSSPPPISQMLSAWQSWGSLSHKCPLSLWRLLHKNFCSALPSSRPHPLPFHIHHLLYPGLSFQLSDITYNHPYWTQSSHRGWRGIGRKPTMPVFWGWEIPGIEGRSDHTPSTRPLPALQRGTESILQSISFKAVRCLEKDQAKNLGLSGKSKLESCNRIFTSFFIISASQLLVANPSCDNSRIRGNRTPGPGCLWEAWIRANLACSLGSLALTEGNPNSSDPIQTWSRLSTVTISLRTAVLGLAVCHLLRE